MSQQRLFPNTSSKFFSIALTPEDERLAMHVSPLFLAYLQNKIEAYASALVEAKLPYSPNPNEQVAAVLAHERLRNHVEAYEELMSELVQASSQPDSN
jgi:hypothetical protein